MCIKYLPESDMKPCFSSVDYHANIFTKLKKGIEIQHCAPIMSSDRLPHAIFICSRILFALLKEATSESPIKLCCLSPGSRFL